MSRVVWERRSSERLGLLSGRHGEYPPAPRDDADDRIALQRLHQPRARRNDVEVKLRHLGGETGEHGRPEERVRDRRLPASSTGAARRPEISAPMPVATIALTRNS